jgi:hypothetical protein
MKDVAGWLSIAALWLIPSSSILGQHSAGIGSHGIGSHGPGASRPAIAPFHMPSSIGLSAPSIGISGAARTHGSFGFGQYPPFNQSFSSSGGKHRGQQPGPWRQNSRYGRGNYLLPFAYLGSSYYPPFDDSFYAPVPETPAPPVEDNGLSDQVQQLSAQIQDLQNQIGQKAAPADTATAPAEQAPAAPPVTLVLKNGQTVQTQNYAVMNNTFWDFSTQPVRKIPVANIDLAASSKASEANGAEFPQIGK